MLKRAGVGAAVRLRRLAQELGSEDEALNARSRMKSKIAREFQRILIRDPTEIASERRFLGEQNGPDSGV
jgi:hypothetical protein